MADFEGKVNQANGRLKASKVGAKIEIRGDRLVLRATLPPKPGSDQTKPHQQRLALGCHANGAGLSIAEAKAREISALVDQGRFDWTPYLRSNAQDRNTVGHWAERFEKNYFEKRERNAETETTWRGDYRAVLNKLPPGEPLTAELLRAAVVETQPDTKTRKRYVMVVSALAKFAGLELDLLGLAGKYGSSTSAPRTLPTDAEIVEWWGKIANPGWRWVYGIMATYGLRNHEVFHLDLDRLRAGDQVLEVLKGKTGHRLVWPFYPEWFDELQLSNVVVPPINTDRSNKEIGAAVTKYFHDWARLPFSPYCLRHCWAIRTIEFLVPVELAARQMGHAVNVHTATYHRWLTADHQQKFFDLMLARPDRPQPPKPPEISSSDRPSPV
jgi:integrase